MYYALSVYISHVYFSLNIIPRVLHVFFNEVFAECNFSTIMKTIKHL